MFISVTFSSIGNIYWNGCIWRIIVITLSCVADSQNQSINSTHRHSAWHLLHLSRSALAIGRLSGTLLSLKKACAYLGFSKAQQNFPFMVRSSLEVFGLHTSAIIMYKCVRITQGLHVPSAVEHANESSIPRATDLRPDLPDLNRRWSDDDHQNNVVFRQIFPTCQCQS